MKKYRKKKKYLKKLGLPPGSLVYTGEHGNGDKSIVHFFSYNPTSYEENNELIIEDCHEKLKEENVNWYNINGLSTENIRMFGEYFGIHSLVLEDILNTDQRPKTELFDNFVFITLKMLRPEADQIVEYEQISIILGRHFVLSIQELEGDIFDSIRERIRTSKGQLRSRKNDYLFYLLIDAIVDQYFVILELLGEKIEKLELEVLSGSQKKHISEIQELKTEILLLRKAVLPIKDAIGKVKIEDNGLIDSGTLRYFDDVHDHVIEISETIELYREMLNYSTDLYNAGMNNKMNEIMKVLTVMSTIFIPLTFIAGVYGMNFKYMPELELHSAYFVVLLVMLGIAIGMIFYFYKKKWF